MAALLVAFQLVAKDTGSKIVYIYASSCGHCDSFLPKFNKAVAQLPDVQVERWDVHANPDGYRVAKELGAKVTPTVFLLQDGVVVDKLEGDVSEQETSAFLRKAKRFKR